MSEVNDILTEPWNGKAGTEIESGLKTEILARALVSAIPTALSQLTNDVGFITSTVDNLVYYYTKSQAYNKSEVDAMIAAVQTMHFEIVAILPETGQANVIYLVPKQPSGYDQYIWVQVEGVYQFVHIGSTDIDLSAYAQKTWVQDQIANFLTEAQIRVVIESYDYTTMTAVEAKGYATETWVSGRGYQDAQAVAAAITTALASYYNKTEVDALIANFVTSEGVEAIVESYGYVTDTQVVAHGYQTSSQVQSTIATALVAYYTSAQVDNLLAGKTSPSDVTTAISTALVGYATQSWVTTQGYQNASQVESAIAGATSDMATQTWVGNQGYQNEAQSKTLVNGVFSFNSETGELDIELYS